MSREIKALKKDLELVHDFEGEFIRMCERRDVPMAAIQRLTTSKAGKTWEAIGERIMDDWFAEQPRPIITVPDLDAVELTALTKAEAKLTRVDEEYAAWDFWKGCLDDALICGRGKRFEVLTWQPPVDSTIGTEVARSYFKKYGFSGNAGVFTALVGQFKPQAGFFTSVPEDNGCWRSSKQSLYIPVYYAAAGCRGLCRDRLKIGDSQGRPTGWDRRWTLVGFREVP